MWGLPLVLVVGVWAQEPPEEAARATAPVDQITDSALAALFKRHELVTDEQAGCHLQLQIRADGGVARRVTNRPTCLVDLSQVPRPSDKIVDLEGSCTVGISSQDGVAVVMDVDACPGPMKGWLRRALYLGTWVDDGAPGPTAYSVDVAIQRN